MKVTIRGGIFGAIILTSISLLTVILEDLSHGGFDLLRADFLNRELIIIPLISAVLGSFGGYMYGKLIDARETEFKLLKEEKEKLDQYRTNFIEITSHELRTPLSIIEGYISVIEQHIQKNDDGKISSFLHIVRKNTERLNQLITSVSELSKIERGIFALTKIQGCFCRFLNEVMYPFKELYASQFQYTPYPNDLHCYLNIDEDRLLHVFVNIINNAIKHTEDNNRMIVVTPEILPDLIRVTITDNGAGISASDLEQIFEPFVSIPTQFSTQGSGIGLFVAQAIINLHGGSIVASSEGLGKGASFIVEISRWEPFS